jgi:hypothetical protein
MVCKNGGGAGIFATNDNISVITRAKPNLKTVFSGSNCDKSIDFSLALARQLNYSVAQE